MMNLDPNVMWTEHRLRTERLRAMMRPGRSGRSVVAAPPPARQPAMERHDDMDTQSVTARLDAALAQQVTLAGGDPAVEAAGETLRAALAPAARQMALELAEQAATEIAAQLPDHDVEVVLRDGEPALAVRQAGGHEPSVDEDLEARITLRLPPSVKARVEEAAGTMGDSVNAWVVKTLSAKATRPSGPGRRVSGTVRT
ncbi:hypothetical protein BH20ACT8_BH20ACT8_00460 [soil metagenome]